MVRPKKSLGDIFLTFLIWCFFGVLAGMIQALSCEVACQNHNIVERNAL